MGLLPERAPFLAAKEGRMARDESERGRDGEDLSPINKSPRRASGTHRGRITKFMDLGGGFSHIRLAKENMAASQITDHAQNMEDKRDRKSKQKQNREDEDSGIPEMGYVSSKRTRHLQRHSDETFSVRKKRSD